LRAYAEARLREVHERMYKVQMRRRQRKMLRRIMTMPEIAHIARKAGIAHNDFMQVINTLATSVIVEEERLERRKSERKATVHSMHVNEPHVDSYDNEKFHQSDDDDDEDGLDDVLAQVANDVLPDEPVDAPNVKRSVIARMFSVRSKRVSSSVSK
jgi:hypothetical protein